MNRIRWANNGECGSDNEWHGYLGKVHICTIDWSNAVFFYPVNHDYIEYSKLSSAKRGAERMLQRFLNDAGLEVRHEYLGRIKMGEVKG